MNKVIVISDSTCDLTSKQIEDNSIKIIPLHVIFPAENIDYLDGVDLTSEELYKKVSQLGCTPKTSAINVGEFINFFKPYIDEGYDIIYTGIGSGLSSTYQNALLASEELGKDRIEVVDSQSLSTGIGLLVLKMCKFRDEGDDVHTIASKVRKLVPLVSAKFCINELDYLNKGGRCSGFTKAMANIFSIHPVAMVTNNKLSLYKIIRGKYRKSVDYQLKMFEEDYPNIDTSVVFVTDSGHMDGENDYAIEQLLKYVPKENIVHTVAGCVISSHCGPKTIGILYIRKPKEE